ncbi:MAG TPA: patatin-like phospholipase family protein [Gordonia sp. (in: high G+C Gram-positive bacteria)]|uniref:patatin-like phospholipase family protein n=1 Tax=unclassified Gordonia (in: high G+C Gram-positive bacteria) TaxID=2657482 RepID=UPI000FBFDE53|nr:MULTISPECIES: patatin-like phospholipase family protein [unclassified Gordonia (in: high G+C Gram-positive bacteria)]RUP41682.1 MAG: patatin-like phospholipase family protein [Gordonia sp. (in: high G+C Gram-positive bacteria)]HNP57295.1 patatin-like phospholipase family protein [Gordonia sp. (in: high G+C Gram-positive bacteria)]HRC52257.1 patatin-like phospholipase family protein [Gordonia sp. (in: high G+C Gram-positive bacteria)]
MNNSPHSSFSNDSRWALVLGGGAATGNAWLIGVMAGLFDGGFDARRADLVVGTSAGSTAAAQIGGADPSELYSAIIDPATVRQTELAAASRPSGPLKPEHLQRLLTVAGESSDLVDFRRRMGAAALDDPASHDGSRRAWWRETVSSRFPDHVWPQRRTLITAVDAATGEPTVFDGSDGVDLVDAVAASCAGGFAYRIGDRHYIDGGYRINAENADLATGYDWVLVLSPLGGRSLLPEAWRVRLGYQVDDLSARGCAVDTVVPPPEDERFFGTNATDLTLRAPAARAGWKQGRALVDRFRSAT